MRVLRSLSAAAGIALLVSGSAGADTPVAITYVPKSLAEASIVDGPWTLHQSVGRNAHDASGIVPSCCSSLFEEASNTIRRCVMFS
jgi:hypothetical protein